MSRQNVLNIRVPTVDERVRKIESEPLPANIGALLDAAVADAPDRVALNFFESGESLTYRELHDRVDRLAAGMAEAGIRAGTHVGVMLPNVAAMPITLLGLARMGAVVVPMNIAYTPSEIAYIAETSDMEWLVIDAAHLPSLAKLPQLPGKLDAKRIFVTGPGDQGYTRWDSLIDGGGGGFTPQRSVELDDMANIQFTSGTTGFPKGCLLSHRYWLTYGKVNAQRDGMVYQRILCASPFFYLDPQWLLMMAFYQRATLFVARRQSGSRFMSWVRKYRINFCILPDIVVKQPTTSEDAQNELVRCNVNAIPTSLHAAIEERFDLIARESFGMTEAGACLFMPIAATDMVGSGSCGKPGPFRRARIVGEDGAAVPPGGVGELQVCGPGIMLRYHKNPQATAAAFDGEWFRTGDLCRQDERGYFYIVGRIKDMIRRAGENIAASEVEAVLAALPQLVDAAVVPVSDETRGEEVKAYVVLRPGLTDKDLSPQAIVDHCAAHLAKFKVPRYIAYRGELPKTPSGKIAKKVLTQGTDDLTAGSYDHFLEKWL